jgi:hypothetical protein
LTVFPLYKEYNLGITVYSEDIKIGEVKWLIRECKSFFKFISMTIKEAILRSLEDIAETQKPIIINNLIWYNQFI